MTDPTLNTNLQTILANPFCVAAMIPGRHPQMSAVGSDGSLRLPNPIQLAGRPKTEWVGVDNVTDLPTTSSHTISSGALAAGKPSIRKVGDVGGRRLLLRARPGEAAMSPFDFRASAAGQGFTALALVKTSALAVIARFLSIGSLATDKFITFNCDPAGASGNGEWNVKYDGISTNRLPISNVPLAKMNTITLIGISASLVPGDAEIAAMLDTVTPAAPPVKHVRLGPSLTSAEIPASITDVCIHGDILGAGSSGDVAIGPVFCFNVALHLPQHAALAAEVMGAMCTYAGITPDT